MKVAFTQAEIGKILAERAAEVLGVSGATVTESWRYGVDANGRDVLKQVEVEFPEQSAPKTGTGGENISLESIVRAAGKPL
jgi:hypothetical protein